MTDTNERDRKAEEFANKQPIAVAGQVIAQESYKRGWDACEQSERVKVLRNEAQMVLNELKDIGRQAPRLREALAAWGEG